MSLPKRIWSIRPDVLSDGYIRNVQLIECVYEKVVAGVDGCDCVGWLWWQQ